MPDLTVICVLWNGDWSGAHHRPYHPFWVWRLKDMVSRHLKRDFDFVCLTNNYPSDFPDDIRVIPLRHDYWAWWSKIEVFREDLDVADRVLYLDLDVLITGDLEPMVGFDSEFALFNVWSFSTLLNRGRKLQSALNKVFRKKGKILIPCYSTTGMIMDKGSRSLVYEQFHPDYMDHYCGDQDWVADCLGREEATFPIGWGRKIKPRDQGHDPITDGTKVVACHPIKLKNHRLKREGYYWAHDLWKGERIDAGTCPT